MENIITITTRVAEKNLTAMLFSPPSLRIFSLSQNSQTLDNQGFEETHLFQFTSTSQTCIALICEASF